MKHILGIELKSDLMPGSGVGFGASVDADVCYDDLGLPYIPGKRIKGCLRTAGEEAFALGEDQCSPEVMEALFGTAELPGALRVRSARLENYTEICRNIKREGLSAALVTERYTSLRRQTAVDELGSARAESLRTIRVINKGYVFLAELEILETRTPAAGPDRGARDAITPGQLQACLATCADNLYSLGMMGNRGLGRIQTTLEPLETHEKPAGAPDPEAPDLKAEAALVVVMRLLEPVIASNRSSQETGLQIPGSTIRGCLLAAWSRAKGCTSTFFQETDPLYQDFSDIFLSGAVRFGDAVITDAAGNFYHPLPANVLAVKDKANTFTDAAVQTPAALTKSVSRRYCRVPDEQAPQALQTLLVETTTAYHMSAKDDRALFQYSALKEGQRFQAEIRGPWEKLKALRDALQAFPRLSVGRSRTAQYGAAQVESLRLAPAPLEKERLEAKDGQGLFLAVLLSPAWLLDAAGMNASDAPAFLEGLHRALTESGHLEGRTLSPKHAFLRVCHLGGYHPVWGLAKQSAHCLDAGSSLLFEVRESDGKPAGASLPRRIRIGENPAESLGEVLIIPYATRSEAVSLAPAPAEMGLGRPSGLPAEQPAESVQAALLRLAGERPIRGMLNNTTVHSLKQAFAAAADARAFISGIQGIKDDEKRELVVSALFEPGLLVRELQFPEMMQTLIDDQGRMLAAVCKLVDDQMGWNPWGLVSAWQIARLDYLALSQRGKR